MIWTKFKCDAEKQIKFEELIDGWVVNVRWLVTFEN